jgi:hypothetical protein
MKTTKWSKMLLVGMFGMVLTFGLMLAGCASWPTEGPSGTLTITDIPAEHEGRLALANLLASNKEIARGNTAVITNGELKLSLYTKKAGYFDNDTLNVRLKIEDPGEAPINNQFGEAGIDAFFESVTFENGVAELKWDDQLTPGFLTVTNIPAEFADNTGAIVYIGNPDYDLKVTVAGKAPIASGTEANCSVRFENGIGTGKFWTSEYGKYRPFPQSGTRDVIVQLATITNVANGGISYTLFQFKAASIQDGKITLDLAKGVKL